MFYSIVWTFISLVEHQSFTKDYFVVCSKTGLFTFNYALTQVPSENFPTWVSLDTSASTISGTAPSVDSDTDFLMNIEATTAQGFLVEKRYNITVKD